MKIDIHRHTKIEDNSIINVRNLFHSQTSEIESDHLYTLGLHPWHVSEGSLSGDIDKVQAIAGNPEIIAIGEAGIDKSISIPYVLQLIAFKEQVNIARKVDKPMIIHCVKAYNEMGELKSETKHMRPWIIHWFNSNAEMGLQLVSKDFYLSFGHMLFNEKSKAYQAFTKIPLEGIFLETDDTGYTIHEVYEKAAMLRGISGEMLEQQIAGNFKKCFNIDL